MRWALLLLAACTAAKDAAGELGGTIGEQLACPADLIDCGHVLVCGGVEFCFDDDMPEGIDAAEAKLGDCYPTPRHEGLCAWCCGEGCPAHGCNSGGGCWCE